MAFIHTAVIQVIQDIFFYYSVQMCPLNVKKWMFPVIIRCLMQIFKG